MIGGPFMAAAENVIANNGGDGVQVDDGSNSNAILSNLIFSNGTGGTGWARRRV